MGELIGDEAITDLAERLQKHDHPISNTTLVFVRCLADDLPLLLGGFIHPAEAVGVDVSGLSVVLGHGHGALLENGVCPQYMESQFGGAPGSQLIAGLGMATVILSLDRSLVDCWLADDVGSCQLVNFARREASRREHFTRVLADRR